MKQKNYIAGLYLRLETIGALSIFGLAMIFRVIGYFFDKMLAKK